MPKEIRKGIPFWICLVFTISLLVAGFIVPPTGIIDGSVLEGAALLFGFATLAQIPVIIQVAGYVRMTKGDVTIEASRKPEHHENHE